MTAILCTSHTIINPFVPSLTQQVTACSNDFLLMKYVGTNGLNLLFFGGNVLFTEIFVGFVFIMFMKMLDNLTKPCQSREGRGGWCWESGKGRERVGRGGDGRGGRRREGKGREGREGQPREV